MLRTKNFKISYIQSNVRMGLLCLPEKAQTRNKKHVELLHNHPISRSGLDEVNRFLDNILSFKFNDVNA